MKKILLWELAPRADGAPLRLTVDDALASAAVRAGVAAAADPAEQGALSAGGALDPGSPTEIVLMHGTPPRIRRVMVPRIVALTAMAVAAAAASDGSPQLPTNALLHEDFIPELSETDRPILTE